MSSLRHAIAEAKAAQLDARTTNIRFQHRQLLALFKLFQQNASSFMTALEKDGLSSAQISRLEQELAVALDAVTKAIEAVPKDMNKWSKEFLDRKPGSHEREIPAGVCAIVVNQRHPIASLIVPLAGVISKGNAAVVVLPIVLSNFYAALQPHFHHDLDQFAYHLVSTSDYSDLTGATCLTASNSETLYKAQYSAVFPTGPNAVLIDQSILSEKQLAQVKEGSDIPTQVTAVVCAIAQAIKVAGGQAKSKQSQFSSLATPSYILCHERILPLILRSLQAELPSSIQVQQQNLETASQLLESATPTSLNYLPVFSVTSFNYAVDLVTDDLPPSVATYVFAEKSFGIYAANQIETPYVCINEIPESILVAGPYTSVKPFQFSKAQYLQVAKSVKSPRSAVKAFKNIKARNIKQVAGFRIDFFGGSFLSAALPVLLSIVGLSGYGGYKAISLGVRAIQNRFF